MDAAAQPHVSKADAPTIGRTIFPMLLLSLAMVAGFTALQSFGIMGESAKSDMGMSDVALGTVQGVAAALSLVLFSIPIGILVDRGNRVRLLILLSITWTLGTVVTAAAPNVALLFVGRMLTGIGTAGALTAVLSLAADMCLPHQRGRAMLINTLGKQLGIAAGFALAGALLGLFGKAGAPHWFGDIAPWRSSQWVLAIASAILTLPLFFLREPERHEVEDSPNAPLKIVMGELWQRRAFLLPLFVGQTSVVMADAAAGIWASPVLERSYGLKPDEFGGWLGGIIFVTGILGAILGGLAADWGKKSGKRGALLYGAVAAALIGVPAALFPIMPSVTGFAVMIFMLILAGTITGLITSVALTVLLPNELRGLSIGAFISIAGLIGFGVAPTLVTLISGFLGGEAHLAQGLAIVGVIVGIVSVLGFILSVRHAPLDALDHED